MEFAMAGNYSTIGIQLLLTRRVSYCCMAVNMDRKKCGTFSFRWLPPDIYHINIFNDIEEPERGGCSLGQKC